MKNELKNNTQEAIASGKVCADLTLQRIVVRVAQTHNTKDCSNNTNLKNKIK